MSDVMSDDQLNHIPPTCGSCIWFTRASAVGVSGWCRHSPALIEHALSDFCGEHQGGIDEAPLGKRWMDRMGFLGIKMLAGELAAIVHPPVVAPSDAIPPPADEGHPV